MLQSRSFPFVTLPTFEVIGMASRLQAKIESFVFSPVVELQLVSEWEQFVEENKEWINLSRSIAAKSPEAQLTASLSTEPLNYTSLPRHIHSWESSVGEIVSSYQDIFLPWWYQTPPPNTVKNINMDFLSHPEIAYLFDAMRKSNQIVMSNFTDISQFVDNAPLHNSFHELYSLGQLSAEAGNWSDVNNAGPRLLVGQDNFFQHPHSLLLQPVYRDLYNFVNTSVAGVILAVVAWDAFAVDLLPLGVQDVQLVLRNSCGGEATYLVQGPFVSQAL
jgi:hypothetical protein